MNFPYLDGLNTAQREAVENVAGPSLVIAGAGSGKTRVLTMRIAHLLRLGNAPSTILALTFTNKAAREMKEHIAANVGNDIARYLWMGTFHSIFSRILRTEAETLGFPTTFTIYDTSDSKSVIRSIIKELGLDHKVYKPGGVLNRISNAKNSLITAQAYAQNSSILEYDRSIQMPRIFEIYKIYAKRCRTSGAMDFDDLLLYTNLLFHQNPAILQKYQEKFHYVLVDEYQDTNYSQYLIVKKLAEKRHNICVVGDDAQSIYSFRGARIENILNFKNDYPSFKTFKLEQNYRSTKTIVNAANSVIKKNKKQLHKEVFSENEPGAKIKVLQAYTDNEEGIIVVSELNQHRLREHDQFIDYAILYRTNSQSRIFEEQLRKQNIPFKIYGGLSFYERKEIKDLLAYLRLVVNSNDNEAFKRVINYPARGIGGTTLDKLEHASSGSDVSIWEVANKPNTYALAINKGTLSKIDGFCQLINQFRLQLIDSTAYEIALSVARHSGIIDDLNQDKTPENLSKFQNIQELLNSIQDFSLNALEEGRPNRLDNYLEEIALITDQDTDKEEDKNRVTLMTIHSAKGLEFKNVFVVGLEEKLFPSNFSGFLTEESLEEERRLFYVAITRAMKNAWLSFAQQRYNWGQLNFCEPSRFISEIDEQYLANVQINNLRGESPAFGRNLFDSPQTYARTNLQAPPKREYLSNDQQPTSKRLTQLKQAMARPSFEADDPNAIGVGSKIEHQRFGQGIVTHVEGEGSNKKATVNFKHSGERQLLLKFAKLRIID
jgi:DNA helicase II / ATP-dependent DNA helicase PcrA